ncbi:MAG: AAA family ATPase, partial [candidate division WOR-3 bacterium]|nr:AAA family ATPase [candidate division WOR-3 bacterium]
MEVISISKIGNKIVVKVKQDKNLLEFIFSRFRIQDYNLKSFCEVYYNTEERREFILCSNVNLESERAYKEFSSFLNEKFFLEEDNLSRGLIHKVFNLVRQEFLKGEEFVLLRLVKDDIGIEEIPQPQYLIYPFIYQNQVNLLYGEGGTFKSFFALYLIKQLLEKNQNANILYLNYETDEKEIYRRLKLLDIDKLYHRYCSIPITEETEKIAEFCAEKNIDLVILDSIGVAISNLPLNDPQSATALFSSIRELKTTCLLIGHQPKQSNDLPFGSVYFYNLARNVWKTEVFNDFYNTYLVLHHKKDNLSKLKKPQAFKIYIDEISVEFKPTSIESIPELTPQKPTYTRIYELLSEEGAKTPKEIASLLGLKQDVVRRYLNRYKNLFRKNDDKWEAIKHKSKDE